MPLIKPILFVLVTLCLTTNSLAQSKPVYVGITKEKFKYIASTQRNSEWCWAASIQMMFNYYGIDIRQEQIVARSYGTDQSGELPDRAGGEDVITSNLNNWEIDNDGRRYRVTAKLNNGPPTPSYLIEELAHQRPVLIGYRTGPNKGHAVLITACSYYPSENGPIIRSIVVRDPLPSKENLATAGRVEYWGASLAKLIQSHWYVKVSTHSTPVVTD